MFFQITGFNKLPAIPDPINYLTSSKMIDCTLQILFLLSLMSSKL